MMCTKNPHHFSTLILLVIVLSFSNKIQCERSGGESTVADANRTDDDQERDQSQKEPLALPLISDNLYTNVSKTQIPIILLFLFIFAHEWVKSTRIVRCSSVTCITIAFLHFSRQPIASAATYMPIVYGQYVRNISEKSIGFRAATFDSRIAGR